MKLNEGLKVEQPLLKFEAKDEDLVKQVNKYIEAARPSYNTVQKRAKENKKYYLGEQIDESKLKDYQAKVVNNLIFMDMETMLPIITQNTPLPKIIASNKPFSKSLQKVLVSRWEVQDQMLDKNRKAVRANFIELLGSLKYRWDETTNDFVFEYVKSESLMLDPNACDVESLSYVIEFIDQFTLQEVLDKYPSKKEALLKDLGAKEDETDKLGSKLTYVEMNTPQFTVWKCGNVVLEKQKNPNYDWGNAEVVDEMGQVKKVGYNLWKKPRVPYIFFQTFNLGDQMYSNTSLIEQSMKLQDAVNKRKRQISDNADLANGILVGSGEGIKKEEFAKIDDQPKLKVWIGQGKVGDFLTRIPGNPLQDYVFNDLQHSESAIHDIWGIHAITRGADSGADTATQDVLQQKQDYGRIDDIVKAYEDFNEQYYQACFQMMLVHYTEPHVYSFDDEDDLEISRDSIIKAYSETIKRVDSDVVGQTEEVSEGDFRAPIIMVKRGSTLPTDDTSQRNEALTLAKMGKISDIDLYEKLDFADAKEMAFRNFQQQTNPAALFPELLQGAGGSQEQAMGAMQDFQSISQGQEVPVNPEVQDPQTAAAHMDAHNQQLDSQDFQNLSPDLQQMFINHVKQEAEIVKQTIGGAGNAPVQDDGTANPGNAPTA
jgi:hypothetical protein